MNDIRRCDEHGFHEGSSCPVCGATGEQVLTSERRRRLSKFVSGALRHFPGDAGLELDERGWTDADALVAAVESRYDWADREALCGVVATDPKGRFEVAGVDERGASDDSRPDSGSDPMSDSKHAPSPDSKHAPRHVSCPGSSEPSTDEPRASLGDRVRAVYGHSVDVTLERGDGPVPAVLYHGTAPEAVDAIRSEGIRPMSRQLVHLSGSIEAARAVGARHAEDPIVLRVDAASLQRDGHRVTKRGVDVYTTERVPPAYVAELE